MLVLMGCGEGFGEETPFQIKQSLTNTNNDPSHTPEEVDLCQFGRCTGCGEDGCSCFEESVLVLTQSSDGTFEWVAASRISRSSRLVSLNEKSSLGSPEVRVRSIKELSRTWTAMPIYTFSLDNGRQLKVTPNHPMLLSEGRVVRASTIGIGTKFKSLDGSIVQVTNVALEAKEQYVYNFEVEAAGAMGHIIAAEGVLVGDLAWQNKLSHGD